MFIFFSSFFSMWGMNEWNEKHECLAVCLHCTYLIHLCLCLLQTAVAGEVGRLIPSLWCRGSGGWGRPDDKQMQIFNSMFIMLNSHITLQQKWKKSHKCFFVMRWKLVYKRMSHAPQNLHKNLKRPSSVMQQMWRFHNVSVLYASIYQSTELVLLG